MKFGLETLLLFPCCAEKQKGGNKWQANNAGMADYLTAVAYKQLLNARKALFHECWNTDRYSTGKYEKNKSVIIGPDFGGTDQSGKFLPALQRYTGSLYKADQTWKDTVNAALSNGSSPHLLIVSALYGLLHPHELIQDYNLQMSDSPAKRTWSRYMPELLADYVRRNNVKRIVMYFGSSTAYLKVAAQAVKPLLPKGELQEVLQYDVENGNAFHTPHNHGLILLRDLTGHEVSGFTRSIKLRKLAG